MPDETTDDTAKGEDPSSFPIAVTIPDQENSMLKNGLRSFSGGISHVRPFVQLSVALVEIYHFWKMADLTRYSRVAKPKGIKLDDVRGIDEVREEIFELVDFLKDPGRYASIGAKLTKGVLFTGPPGTGKTMTARAIAAEAGVPFFYESASGFDEAYVGTGAKRLRTLFEKARKNQPAIIFVDEIDALAPKRSSNMAVHARQTPNQLLDLLDGFEKTSIVFIGATNSPEQLDPALVRPGRLDKKIHFAPPSLKGRKSIIELYMGKVTSSESVDVETLARNTTGFTGAELSNLINLAAVRCGSRNEEAVTNHHLDWARDRVLMGLENKGRIMSNKDKVLTAAHEAGHAILYFLSKDSELDPLYKVTIVPRGNALGVTMGIPEDDQTAMSYRWLNGRMQILMGGRIAEELAFGTEEVTTGASDDMDKATTMAMRMVTLWGFSDLGLAQWTYNSASESTWKATDERTKGIVDAAFKTATEILTEHKTILFAVSEELLEKETLTGEEVKEIVDKGLAGELEDKVVDFSLLLAKEDAKSPKGLRPARAAASGGDRGGAGGEGKGVAVERAAAQAVQRQERVAGVVAPHMLFRAGLAGRLALLMGDPGSILGDYLSRPSPLMGLMAAYGSARIAGLAWRCFCWARPTMGR